MRRSSRTASEHRTTAGQPAADGSMPAGTVNARAVDGLRKLAALHRRGKPRDD